ncbi:MAG TPA: S1 RNA-binding domain-containing protein [Acidimicrobiales bacterium]|nr:S1 RNA-binding domain-containing protein [Acidimicrobiales bacterium]
MAARHVVVDGSNIATEGRSTPSLGQLENAVDELRKEFPDAEVTVVVDATFAHRIDPSELARFEAAELHGEYVHPPAGAIGRGDAFLLRIAEKVGGIVLSNDSFQEFHGEHQWLFDESRLLGATPVPGVGWIFVRRTPVRGPRSRVATRDAKRAKDRVEKAIAVATKEAVAPEVVGGETRASRSSRASDRSAAATTPQAVNDPMTFISFIAEHPLGEELEAEVESFTSHGAVVRIGDVRCYVPLSGLGSPAPRSARGVLRKGERRPFVITALDPHRRGVELALPGVAVVSGRPSDETVKAEMRMARPARKKAAEAPAGRPAPKAPPAPRKRAGGGATAEQAGAARAAAVPGRAAKAPAAKRALKRAAGAAEATAPPVGEHEAAHRTGRRRVRPVHPPAGSAAPEQEPVPAGAGRKAGARKAAPAPTKAAAPAPAARPAVVQAGKAPAKKSAAAAPAPTKAAGAKKAGKKAAAPTTAPATTAPAKTARATKAVAAVAPAATAGPPPGSPRRRVSPRAAASGGSGSS